MSTCVKFQGILSASIDGNYDATNRTVSLNIGETYTIPQGMEPIAELHVTLLSSELNKETRKRFKKAWKAMKGQVPPFPEVSFGPHYVANNGTKRSIVCDVIEQEKVRAWVRACINALDLDISETEGRVYHVSLATPTGSRYDAVPDPWNWR